MTGFDQAQSPRLGQRSTVEATTVRMFNGTEIPESSWDGMLIYRLDRQVLQIYRSATGAFEDVVGGDVGLLTFVGPEPPVARSTGDLWFDTDNHYSLSRWNGTTWVLVVDTTPEGIANVLEAQTLNAVTIVSGTVVGSTITTAESGPRIEIMGESIDSNKVTFYSSNDVSAVFATETDPYGTGARFYMSAPLQLRGSDLFTSGVNFTSDQPANKTLYGVDGDVASYTVSNGRITIPHILGFKPNSINAMSATVGYTLYLNNGLTTSTNIVLEVRTAANGTVANGTSIGVSWSARYIAP